MYRSRQYTRFGPPGEGRRGSRKNDQMNAPRKSTMPANEIQIAAPQKAEPMNPARSNAAPANSSVAGSNGRRSRGNLGLRGPRLRRNGIGSCCVGPLPGRSPALARISSISCWMRSGIGFTDNRRRTSSACHAVPQPPPPGVSSRSRAPASTRRLVTGSKTCSPPSGAR